jgi:hypothetical protein
MVISLPTDLIFRLGPDGAPCNLLAIRVGGMDSYQYRGHPLTWPFVQGVDSCDGPR